MIRSMQISQPTQRSPGRAGGRQRAASVSLWEEKDAFLSFQGPRVLLAECPQQSALVVGQDPEPSPLWVKHLGNTEELLRVWRNTGTLPLS